VNPLRFLFAVHCHQPVGNFDHVFERAFDECYEPFLAEVAKHPAFKLSLHFSGPLLEHMERRRGKCRDLVRDLVGRGQVELLGGGFYEPILAIIPEEDRLSQIRMMSRYLEEHFGCRPRGLWLTERVWEPHLAGTLARAGIEYTLLDEEHFHYAGAKDTHTSYITEDEGLPLRVFPIDKQLRYLIPFRALSEVDAAFAAIREQGGIAVLGDDGEKFGLWPGTAEWVYGKGWLGKFLNHLEETGVRTMTLSEYADSEPPGGRIYLPPASYEEMTEWVLEPSELTVYRETRDSCPSEARRFLRGGFFRDFFLKYPESNWLHKRMLSVSKRVAALGNREAARELSMAQCNDPYWHGVFGGLYLPHLREAAWRHLLEAEKALPGGAGWREEDLDLDGRSEFSADAGVFGLVVKPSFGGAVVEIDHRPTSRNITDVLSRRPESYHARGDDGTVEGKSIHELTKRLPPGAEEMLRYDRQPRFSCLDRFLRPATQVEDIRRAEYGELGNFVDGEYAVTVEGAVLALERKGSVRIDGEDVPVVVRKRIGAEDAAIRVRYEIANAGEQPISLTFASEWNFYMLPDEFALLADGAELMAGRLSFRAEEADEVWSFPLRTLSQSEKDYDIIHQGFCILLVRRFMLAGGEAAALDIVLAEKHAR
jgi:alpha-amylase